MVTSAPQYSRNVASSCRLSSSSSTMSTWTPVRSTVAADGLLPTTCAPPCYRHRTLTEGQKAALKRILLNSLGWCTHYGALVETIGRRLACRLLSCAIAVSAESVPGGGRAVGFDRVIAEQAEGVVVRMNSEFPC